jgi:membrane protease YdiL (CAAX protease family)
LLTSPIPQRNPYLAILRREYPEPLIALLAFILGIWLWDQHFGKSQGYAPGTEASALIKVDRDLRLADAMVADPVWLRWLAGVDAPVLVRGNALRMLEKLAAAKSISPAGVEAHVVIKAVDEGRGVGDALAAMAQAGLAVDVRKSGEHPGSEPGTWWQVKRAEETGTDASWRGAYDEDSARLRVWAVTSRSLIWLIGGLGLFFIPHTLRGLKRAMQNPPGGYCRAWTIPLGSTVFLVATLAWIGFTMVLETGISALPGLHPALLILLDGAARMLPPLIALGLLFRRPSHAVRSLGLARLPDIGAVAGLFALLIGVDQLLRLVVGSDAATDPGGGLSLGDAGSWGLAYSVVSACLLAPLAEELLYRGVLFRSLGNRLGVPFAAVLSSGVFAILHFYNGYGLLSVGIFGLACAFLYAATGSLSSSILLHVLYNSAIKIPEWVVYHRSLD